MTIATNIAPIEIPFPAMSTPHLRIAAAACIVQIEPGDAEPWVQGSYVDPSARMPIHIRQDDEGAVLRVGTDMDEILGLLEGPQRLYLRLGTAREFSLTIDAGASEIRLELGGVPLARLTVHEGAGKTTLAFSAPNPVRMERLQLGVGAGAVEAHGLANAAFSEMEVDGGAASVQLAFGGHLRRDAQVRIATALSGIELGVPSDVAAEVTWATLVGAPQADAGFTRHGDMFCRPSALAGHEPQPRLRIHNVAALGGLQLRSLWPAAVEA